MAKRLLKEQNRLDHTRFKSILFAQECFVLLLDCLPCYTACLLQESWVEAPWQIADVPINNLSRLMDGIRGKKLVHTYMHTNPCCASLCVPFPNSGHWEGHERQQCFPGEGGGCLISVYLSWHHGAAFQMLTHLLLAQNSEMVQLFNQGIWTASCSKET